MSLTSADEIRLTNIGLMEDYNDKKYQPIWLDMAQEAYTYARQTLGGKKTPKPDDVAPHLALALEVRPEFDEIRTERGAKAKYWYRLFADLIVDRTWSKLK